MIDMHNATLIDQDGGNIEMFMAEDFERIGNENEKLETCQPAWLGPKGINDVIYCDLFAQRHPLIYLEDEGFRDVDGVISEGMVRNMIHKDISPFIKPIRHSIPIGY